MRKMKNIKLYIDERVKINITDKIEHPGLFRKTFVSIKEKIR